MNEVLWIKILSILYPIVVEKLPLFQGCYNDGKFHYQSKYCLAIQLYGGQAVPTKNFERKIIRYKGQHAKKYYSPVVLSLNRQSIEERQIDDLEKYSVPFLTHYEDRMSMAWSREIRLPFLDYRLLSYCTFAREKVVKRLDEIRV